MGTEDALKLIDRQNWLDPVADAVQLGVHQTFESAGEVGRDIKDALHGTWLGHPVHAAITDVPVGAWTAALALDAVDEMSAGDGFGKAADLAITVGLAGAALSAVTGLTDWSDTDGRARKMGLVHGILNLTSSALYVTSLVCRSRNDRSKGRGLAALGFAISAAAAWLGGEMVYKEQVGIDHAAGAPSVDQWSAVCPESDLEDHKPKRVDLLGYPVLLVRREGRIYAIGARCSHLGGPLDEGQISGDTVTCPWHGSEFNLTTGCVIHGPATSPQPRFEARVNNGQVELRSAD